MEIPDKQFYRKKLNTSQRKGHTLMQNIFFLRALAEQEVENKSREPSFLDSFNDIFQTLQNGYTLLAFLIVVLLITLSIFSVRKRAKNYTEKEINSLKDNGKYIPGLFVELNESKEVLRYFVYGTRWKHRLIRKFNYIYDNVFGDILKKGTIENNLKFHLSPFASLDEIEAAVDSCREYHEEFKKRNVKLKPQFQESSVLFEIYHYSFSDTLEELRNKTKSAKYNYLVLTGSAGNGKTNLLCSLSELAILLKHTVLFLNSRDMPTDISGHILKCLKAHKKLTNHKKFYFWAVNALLWLRRKKFFIFIDAVNENENIDFAKSIQTFVNDMEAYHCFKIIVSCRNEYYNEKYAEVLSHNINQEHLVYDLRTGSYPHAAIERLINCYKSHFKYEGYISDSVKHVICEHLLLLRIFFEVNKESDQDILSIEKYKIFDEYIRQVKDRSTPNIEIILDTIADSMLQSMSFEGIESDVLASFSQDEITKAFDETILLNQKLVYNKDTIARQEKEIVYFVFDEIRDYYIAKRIMQKHTKYGLIDSDAILNDIQGICNAHVSCEEGVIQYTYIFFKTANIESEEREKACIQILELYRIHDGHKPRFYRTHHREEFSNYGLKILLTSEFPLSSFELDFIRDCLKKAPNEDGGKVFDTLLAGTIYGLPNDLNLYFNILFGIKDQEDIIKIYQTMSEDSFLANTDLPLDLVQIHKDLNEKYPERAVQVQMAAELFLGLFILHDSNYENELKNYFYTLQNHEQIYNEMKTRFEQAKGENT